MDLDSAKQIRGYCWFVRPEPKNVAGVLPFQRSGSHGADPTAEVVRPPAGVEVFWALGSNTVGIKNKLGARTYLVVTTTEAPPPVNAGWQVEPAVLDDDFQLDQRGSSWVHLLREAGSVETPLGRIQICEFESVSV